MGLLDSILSQVTGGGQANPLVNAVVGMLGNQSSGGLAGLVDQFAKAGFSQQAASWVSTGQNQAITGDHVNQALGGSKVQELAAAAGLNPAQAASMLAQVIPLIVDKLTPQGSVPQGDSLKNALAGFLQGGPPKA